MSVEGKKTTIGSGGYIHHLARLTPTMFVWKGQRKKKPTKPWSQLAPGDVNGIAILR